MKKKAFTLIELLVVIGIIIVLIGLTSVGVSAAVKKAKIQKAQAEVRNILSAVNLYRSETGLLPGEIKSKQLGKALSKNQVYGAGGNDLLFGPYFEFKESNSRVDGSDFVLIDPWGQDYIYAKAGEPGDLTGYNNGDFPHETVENGFSAIFSKGPDEIPGNNDDVGTWS